MKISKLLIILNFFAINFVSSQDSQQSKFFIYWGWNREVYSTSEIKFIGKDFNFSLKNVSARDKPTTFTLNNYLNPARATIPQFNFRLGYFISEKYSISAGIDHMKYVVTKDQSVGIHGNISIENSFYKGSYDNQQIVLSDSFLKYEHTNGLNCVQLEFRRHDQVYDYKKFHIELVTGLGTGAIIPKSDVTLLNMPRHDKFHLAGFSVSGILGLQWRLGKYFFMQTEAKFGYINLNDVLIDFNKSDRARQEFLYLQYNLLFGSRFWFK